MIDRDIKKTETQKRKGATGANSDSPVTPSPLTQRTMMHVSAYEYAPKYGAIELIILDTLKSATEAISPAVLRDHLAKYSIWQNINLQKVHRVIGKLLEDRLVSKKPDSSRHFVKVKITAKGLEQLEKDKAFFASL